MKKILFQAFILAFLIVTAITPAVRAQVVFDSSFSGHGLVQQLDATAFRHIVLPGGKIMATANTTWGTKLYRFNKDGSIDSSYGPYHTGWTDAFDCESDAFLARLPNDSIVIYGTPYLGFTTSYSSQLTVTKLDSAGNMCGNFGTGGKRQFPMPFLNWFGGRATAMALQPDGKILLSATVGTMFPPTCVMRFMPDGQYDTSFGPGGAVLLPFGSCGFQALGIHFQSSGKIIIAGDYYTSNSRSYYGVCRLRTNGIIDSTFGTNGASYTGGGGVRSSLVQADDKIVLSASGGYFIRFFANGDVDTAFGNRGSIQHPMGLGAEPRDIHTDAATGAIYVYGHYFIGNGVSPGPYRQYLMRLKPSGSIDSAFNNVGYFDYAIPGTAHSATMCLLSGDRILMYGEVKYGSNPYQLFLSQVLLRPVIEIAGNAAGSFCAGDTATLIAHTTGAVRWMCNGSLLADTGYRVRVWQPGAYRALTSYGSGGHDTSAGTTLVFHAAVVPIITATGSTLVTGGGQSYQWYDSSRKAIPGATAASYIAGAQGVYYVAVSDSNGCRGISAGYVYIPTAAGAAGVLAGGRVSVFPNPFHDRLAVRNDLQEPVSVMLYDAIGRRVQAVTVGFGITELPAMRAVTSPGQLYFLKITGAGFSGVLQVVHAE